MAQRNFLFRVLDTVRGRIGERIYLHSSNPQWFEYAADTQTLRVGFSRGHVYEYYNVEAELLEEWQNAPSRGKWFLANMYYGTGDGYDLVRGGNSRRRGRDGRFR